MVTKEKERQIMMAAEQLFTSRRFHEITMDDVSQMAGVGKGTIYRYFKDKDELFLRVAMSGFEELQEIVSRIPTDTESFDQQLHRVLKELRGFFTKRRQMYRIMQTEAQRLAMSRGVMKERMKERHQQLLDILSGLLDRGVSAGEIRSDVSTREMASLLLGMLRGATWESYATIESKDPAAVVTEMFLHGASPSSSVDKRGEQ